MIMAKTINGELNKQEVHEDFVKKKKKRGWIVIEETNTKKVSEEPLTVKEDKLTKEIKIQDTNGKKTSRPETGGKG